MKAARRRFSPFVYRAILVKQAWRCACCGECFYQDGESRIGPLPFHFDHITSLEAGGEDTKENLQALLIGHHKQKSGKESAIRAKVKRIIAQRGLLDKKMSQRDKVMAKVLAEG